MRQGHVVDAGKSGQFHISMQSNERDVRAALSQVMQDLESLTLDLEQAGTVELVLAEALNNVLEHGYANQNNTGPIDIVYSTSEDGLHFQIRDQGRPMPGGCAPVGHPPDVAVPFEHLPEGGFGWFLIQDLAEDVIYRRKGNENQLNLRIALGAG